MLAAARCCWSSRCAPTTAPPRALAFRTLLIGAIPAYLVMRVGAEWIADKENLVDSDAAWISIGYGTRTAGCWC